MKKTILIISIIVGVILGGFYYISQINNQETVQEEFKKETENNDVINESENKTKPNSENNSNDEKDSQLIANGMTLSEAQSKIGMECTGSDISMDCKWNNVEYSFYKPENWEKDKNKRIKACEEGWVNKKYNMVTDNATWYATTNFGEDNQKLQETFSEIGFDSEISSYCH